MTSKKEVFTIWHGLLLAEVAALLISLAITLVPSKSGSDYSFADHFFDDATFIQELIINFLFTNTLIAIVAVFSYIWIKLSSESHDSSS